MDLVLCSCLTNPGLVQIFTRHDRSRFHMEFNRFFTIIVYERTSVKIDDLNAFIKESGAGFRQSPMFSELYLVSS